MNHTQNALMVPPLALPHFLLSVFLLFYGHSILLFVLVLTFGLVFSFGVVMWELVTREGNKPPSPLSSSVLLVWKLIFNFYLIFFLFVYVNSN